MQIVFTKEHTLLSFLVRYFTKRSWVKSARVSHVALRYGASEANWMVEASTRGFWPNWWNKFKKTCTVCYQFEVVGCDPAILEKLLDEFIDDRIGEPYNYSGIAGMLLVVMWYWLTGKKVKNPLGMKGSLTCSETAYRYFDKVFKVTGIRYFKEQDAETTFPEELLIQCETTPDRFAITPLTV